MDVVAGFIPRGTAAQIKICYSAYKYLNYNKLYETIKTIREDHLRSA